MATKRWLALVLLSTMLIVACGARSVRVAELRDQPSRYDDKTISVTGVVTSSFGFPLSPLQFYNVDDGTGEITVLSRTGRTVPSRGARIQVKGRINQLGSFGSRTIGLHIEERDRDIR